MSVLINKDTKVIVQGITGGMGKLTLSFDESLRYSNRSWCNSW